MLREDIALVQTASFDAYKLFRNSKRNFQVSVRLTSDFFVRSEVSPRRTPADKVSQFGGVVGLCSGMCALTLLEVMFWAGKAVRCDLDPGQNDAGEMDSIIPSGFQGRGGPLQGRKRLGRRKYQGRRDQISLISSKRTLNFKLTCILHVSSQYCKIII